ncbi:hypothetical protein GGE16_000826 [Rhizobium leguminosarum]|uniref:Uncharacterized protein n=2 Tax=Rhizobium leguminosarum TaxID=384 RepID=A0AAE2MGQ3_RHILE|nr:MULTISPECIES: hypothetical protein [Rhizobium]MBB4288810.1 hypothetical protein [Rhizobium leguminosarum]MBB4295097.1 hypothetical protein [Rhizobium leguminosarum]MBB4306490.1 hypothetical protein [Rhizobium leguminosarum]MBB4417929.1 hypothetical protein [Rhizobium leguminosarum]MBB4432774.1 hypothetical protein [Rhizobium esperanzae]
MLLEVKFEGGLAEQHKIPAYEGTKSLEGLTRSMLIVANFLVEGRVRRKEFGRIPLTFNLLAQRPGSFESLYEIGYQAAVIGAPVAGGLALGAGGNLLYDLFKVVYRRVTGGNEEAIPASVQELEVERGGDVAALIEAVEPSVRLGHNVINHGVMNINLNVQAAAPAPIVQFNPQTKQYMWESVINNDIRLKLFSMASFNANQGTGRAFDLEEGRSVPFELGSDVDRLSVDTLLGSISSYTRRKRLGDDLRSAVAVMYTSVEAADGRIKKIRILAVRNEIQDFGRR